ncbi:MAG: tetratricopeptide repeat protein [Rhodoluna sp.]|nr:tetratricopeptide repeat protein [Rhodoluna sp.]
MKKILLGLIFVISAQVATNAQTSKTTIGGQTLKKYSSEYQNYSVPSYGYVQRYYENGAWHYYVNGSLLDYNYFGNLKTITSSMTFDVGKVGGLGRSETDQKFALIWQTFRETHALNSEGRYKQTNGANTPANKLTLFEFAHYVAEARPAISINSIEKCPRCSGKRMRTGLTPTGAVGEVPCDDCNAYGSIAKQENFALIISGPMPPRPKLEELIKEGLIPDPASKLPPTPPPAPIRPPVQSLPFAELNMPKDRTPAPKPAEVAAERPTRDLTPEERYISAKAKAEAGDAQAQYELGLFYSQDFERAVALDYFEAFNWAKKASLKNHRMAQRLLAKFYELGRGTDKNLEESIKWYRSSALLGCKQSQRWMGQMYHTTFQGSKTYEDFIKKDISNLSEAYAWFLLGAERSIPTRPDIKIATSEELAFGPALTPRDYSFEISAQSTCEGERDNVAKNTNFNRTISDSAKSRYANLQAESADYMKANRPR